MRACGEWSAPKYLYQHYEALQLFPPCLYAPCLVSPEQIDILSYMYVVQFFFYGHISAYYYIVFQSSLIVWPSSGIMSASIRSRKKFLENPIYPLLEL